MGTPAPRSERSCPHSLLLPHTWAFSDGRIESGEMWSGNGSPVGGGGGGGVEEVGPIGEGAEGVGAAEAEGVVVAGAAWREP